MGFLREEEGDGGSFWVALAAGEIRGFTEPVELVLWSWDFFGGRTVKPSKIS